MNIAEEISGGRPSQKHPDMRCTRKRVFLSGVFTRMPGGVVVFHNGIFRTG